MAKSLNNWRGLYFPSDAILFLSTVLDSVKNINMSIVVFANMRLNSKMNFEKLE